MVVNQHIVADYIKDISRFQLEEQKLARRSTIYSLSRLIIFIMTIIGVIVTISLGKHVPVLISFLGLTSFLYVVKIHHRNERERRLIQYQKELTENEISVLREQINNNYDGSKYIDQEHDFSADLDVFGSFSLFGLINRCRTYNGLGALAQYLSVQPTLSEIQKRKILIQDLEADKEWRIKFLSCLYEIKDGHINDVATIVNNILDTDFSFATGMKLSLYRRILPFMWLFFAIMYFYIPDWVTFLAIVLGLINFRINMGYATKVTQIQFRLSKAGDHLDKYADALNKIYSRSWKSSQLAEEKDSGDTSTHTNKVEALTHLKKLSDLLDYRLHMIPSLLLNISLLWDSRIVAGIAEWKDQNHPLIDGIFGLIGKVEALVSLATWSDHHPQFCYAEIDKQYFHLEGRNLRHPLVPYEACKPNDFNVCQGDFINIVTGSNMSGKSTFLRTLGLNIVLGYAGGRVAADYLSFSLSNLITYMRIKDSLEENVSTFKAELNRIAKILDLMKTGIPVFVLADEMLRGTNSKDKLQGSKAIILKILEHKSYAVVATHDISLTQLGALYPGQVNNYFFDIDYAEGELLFDYKIKKGICENFNASFLLGQLGINVTHNNSS